MTPDSYFLGGEQITLDSEESRARLVQRLRQYLELRNLNLLIGNGASLPLGAPRIGDIGQIRADFSKEPYRLKDAASQERALKLLDKLVPEKTVLGVEPLLTALANVQAIEQLLGGSVSVAKNNVPATDAKDLERLLKKWLFQKCRQLSDAAVDLRYHEELLRRVLLRSTTLPRSKVLTLNYDLLLERALDSLGVHYFDGFLGTITRTMRTESYHYDLYYPGETTEGRVSRVDRVLHLYKLHGSINWRRRASPAGDVFISHTEPAEAEYGDVMIYPSPLKVTEMNGYPYSEMFRHFSTHIHQPQSALIVIGYAFQDSHVNRLIYQALTIPSFVLIVVTPDASNSEITRLNELKSKRIIILTGAEKNTAGAYVKGAGTMQDFSTVWLPDITELNVESSAREEVKKMFDPATAPPTL